MDHRALVLQVWEAVNTERHLQGVIEAASDLVLPAVQFDSLAIIHFDGASHDLYTLHTPGNPLKEGETVEQFLHRAGSRPMPMPTLPVKPYDPVESNAYMTQEMTHHLRDLFALKSWYEHEVALARAGVRAYCSLTLRVRGKTIGGAAYSRRLPVAFTDEELALLQAVCRRSRLPFPTHSRMKRLPGCGGNCNRKTLHCAWHWVSARASKGL